MRAFVICRDRVTYARQCVDALRTVGERLWDGLDIVIVDHGSTWPPMVEWLDTVGRSDGVQVSRWDNRHPRDLWAPAGIISHMLTSVDERFLVTDCDVIPDPDCPTDWPQIMNAYLDHLPAVRKVGLGLRTDDIPAHHAHRDMVQAWEAQYQAPVAAPVIYNPGAAGVFADIDTTLAMYRRCEPFALGPAVRLQAPYVARHLPWYEDTLSLDAEQAYYREHAVHGHWRDPGGYADDYKLRG